MDISAQTIAAIGVGLGLAAACGFRVFVPLLVLSLAANWGYVPLAPGWTWIGTSPAIIAFGTATLLEAFGYFIPWVDHALDVAATPAAVLAGMVEGVIVVDAQGRLQLVNAAARQMLKLSETGIGRPYIETIRLPAIAELVAKTLAGSAPDAKCTVSATDQDFLAIVNGRLNAQMAFMSGKLKIQGDMGLAMKLQQILT